MMGMFREQGLALQYIKIEHCHRLEVELSYFVQYIQQVSARTENVSVNHQTLVESSRD